MTTLDNVLFAFRQNVAELERALETVELGFVCVWPKYGLGVRTIDSSGAPLAQPAVVGTVNATIFRTKRAAMAQTFRNGAGEMAEVMSVYDARVAALDSARADIARMEKMMQAR